MVIYIYYILYVLLHFAVKHINIIFACFIFLVYNYNMQQINTVVVFYYLFYFIYLFILRANNALL